MPTLADMTDNIYAKILLTAASHDYKDFYKLRKTCRGFLKVPSSYIWARVSLTNYDRYAWGQDLRHYMWFYCCVSAGNPEAIFQNALDDFGLHFDDHRWVRSLRSLTDRGFPPALYATGIFHLFYGERELAFEALNHFMSNHSHADFLRAIEDCRNKCKAILAPARRNWFFHMHPFEDPDLLLCSCAPNCPSLGADQDWNPDANLCTCYNACFWNHESALVTRGMALIPRV